MTLALLTDSLRAKNPSLGREDARDYVEAILTEMRQQIIEAGTLRLAGFGIFNTTLNPARPGRNPKTGEPMQIEPFARVNFRPGEVLKAAVLAALEKKAAPKAPKTAVSAAKAATPRTTKPRAPVANHTASVR